MFFSCIRCTKNIQSLIEDFFSSSKVIVTRLKDPIDVTEPLRPKGVYRGGLGQGHERHVS